MCRLCACVKSARQWSASSPWAPQKLPLWWPGRELSLLRGAEIKTRHISSPGICSAGESVGNLSHTAKSNPFSVYAEMQQMTFQRLMTVAFITHTGMSMTVTLRTNNNSHLHADVPYSWSDRLRETAVCVQFEAV